ncbi:adenylate/guanylate cyclase domain-containing protein [Chitinophaga sp. Ak27]|uniref:adenylate/guanylate cyclase domain-containing protein n=1 Tax=Chitinophaga sp. Ak27 TaxID=2726116 RepID=UPI00145EA609|nr:adenylate/guanylate cyclase domain-containing protein [Chitinophaga sp. Ak27]NLU94883.1 adenylate/guanylate cyclase domain-containing protein [Chitinophaga sp. Ak27]
MSVKSIIDEIEADVADVIDTQFGYSPTFIVPSPDDPSLSYERGKQKSGKVLSTCVLYVDIRNSVTLNDAHKPIRMAKIYTAFIKAVIKAGREHGGHTRNIIGDRVMIVFPAKDCFVNAVECAITINHVVKYILKPEFAPVDFKCGIGVDFGELKILKVGIQRNGTEGPQNKGLVWAGYPANVASRLTDVANKKMSEEYYYVVRNPINPRAIQSPYVYRLQSLGLKYDPKAPYYLTSTETVKMTESEFAKSFFSGFNGYSTLHGRMISFQRKTEEFSYSPILITDRVLNGLKKIKPAESHFWKEQQHKIKNVDCKVYGADIHWTFNK